MSYWKSVLDKQDLSDIIPERLQQAIDVMQRVKDKDRAFNMECWQIGNDIVATESELHKCGTAACFGGWLSVSSEFQNVGGYVDMDEGDPMMHGRVEGKAVHAFLVDNDLFTDTGVLLGNLLCNDSPGGCIYPDEVNKITIDEVLERLFYVRDLITKRK